MADKITFSVDPATVKQQYQADFAKPATPASTPTFPEATFANISNAQVGDKFTNSKGVTFAVTQADIDDAKARLTPTESAPPAPPVQETVKDEPVSTKPVVEPKEELKPASPYGDKSAKIGKYLARNMIEAYNNGDFGKKGTKEAKLNMGLYILNEIGTRLVNASSVARGGQASAISNWQKMREANEETNKSIRAYEAQYNAAKEELLASMPEEDRNRITPAELDSKVLELLQRKGITTPQSREGLATTDQSGVVKSTEIKKGVVELKTLEQNQKAVATQNLTALIERKKELQTLIASLKADKGWDAYRQAMEAYVGTARGLESTGLSDNATEAVNSGRTLGVSANVGTGGVASKFVDANLTGNASWTNSASSATGKSTTLSKDSLALSRFKDASEYSKASADARVSANEQLINNLQSEIDIINKAIQAWGKDLGVVGGE